MSFEVVIKYCADYDSSEVESALDDGINAIGGIEQYIKPGQKVFLKVNLLLKKSPEEAVTTHPAVVEAVVRQVQKAGGIVIIGDSPGGPYNVKTLRAIYERSGLEEVARRTGAILNENVGQSTVSWEEGKYLKSLTVTQSILDADVIISLSKLKTHGMMTFTGAVKNLFGVIPGLLKAEYHLKMPGLRDFAEVLVDICLWAKPTLSIMDGIIGMEGDGPSGGKPRSIKAMLISTNPFALDVAAVHLIGMKTEYVPTLMAAKDRGLPFSLKDVMLKGDDIAAWDIKDFLMPKTISVNFIDILPFPSSVKKLMMDRVRPYPDFKHEICVGCRDCMESCPPGAITMNKNKRPQVDLQSCIRCFCCQELCPHKAIEIAKPFLGRILFR